MATVEVISSGTGVTENERLQNTVTAANNSGSRLSFAANRTTSGLTDVASVEGLITDITQSAYKGALTFSTADNAAPAERMRIDRSGNVGIGTASPNGQMHLAGAGPAVTDNYGLIVDQKTSGTNNWNIWSGPAFSSFSTFAKDRAHSANVLAGPVNGRYSVTVLTETSGADVLGAYSLNLSTGNSPSYVNAFFAESNWLSGSGTLAWMSGIEVSCGNETTGTVTDNYGVYVYDLRNDGGGTVTNNNAIFVEDQTTASNNTAIRTNQTAGANSYALYNAGTAKSYFGGNVGIGTTSPGSRLDIADGALTLQEMTAPSAPSSHKCVIYPEDDGSGKTRLMVKFATGSAQQIAIEP